MGVWVYDLTRFSRKVIEGERLVELAGRGIRVWSQAGEYDQATADGRAHFREAMVAAARESDKISERVKRGNLRRVRRGRVTGGPQGFAIPGWAPLGPDWVRGDARERVPDEQAAAERALVRECYDRLFAGETITVIVRDLQTRQGCPTTTQGKLWDQTALKVMLTRANVAGLIEYNEELVGERVGVEPIVSREELLRLRAMFDARRRGRPPDLGDYLLSGLVACSVCGRQMNGMPHPRCLPNPDGSPPGWSTGAAGGSATVAASATTSTPTPPSRPSPSRSRPAWVTRGGRTGSPPAFTWSPGSGPRSAPRSPGWRRSPTG
jgi:hypothetical protein